jgi:hypothetical protein
MLSTKAGKWAGPGTTGNGGQSITTLSCTRALFCAAADTAGDALVGYAVKTPPVKVPPLGTVPEDTFVVSGVLNGSWRINMGNTCVILKAGGVEIFLEGASGTQGGGNPQFVVALPGTGHPGYPHAKLQFPSASSGQADLTAGTYGWRAGSTGSGNVALSGTSGSVDLEMTPLPGTATPAPEHVEGRWQCP